MTEYDAFALYREQEEKNKVSALELNNGLITYFFRDGTREVWKKNIFGKLKIIKKRGDKNHE
jgi:hypothetical protein